MKEIVLTKGQVALVDDTDFDRVAGFRWYAQLYGSIWYALRDTWPTREKVRMHRFILNPSEGFVVDHRDRNGLNNTRTNLRVCTQQKNTFNRIGSVHSSRYKGVTWHKGRGRWVAQLEVSGNNVWLGRFRSEEQAALAYNLAAKEAFGEFALLNEVHS
jgi:hypothetical protein